MAESTAAEHTGDVYAGFELGALVTRLWARARRLAATLAVTVAVVGTLTIGTLAVMYVLTNMGKVRVLPFEGAAPGSQLGDALELSEVLNAVGKGAATSVDADFSIEQASAEDPPAVTIPGTSLSLATLIELMQLTRFAQRRVHVGLVSPEPHARLQIEIDGGRTSGQSLWTDVKTARDDAFVDGAERLYAILNPVGAAYYFSTRYPDRSLEAVDRILHDPQASARDRRAALRIWGLVLRDQGDLDGARDQFRTALHQQREPRQIATLLLDIGYTYRLEERWADAVAVFTEATTADPQWPAAGSRLADALVELGALDRAEHEYERVIGLDPQWAEPWRGLAHVAVRRHAYGRALDLYRMARRLSFSARERATADRGVGDVYFELGCRKEAAALYRQAIAIDDGYDPVATEGVCPDGPRDGALAPCAPWSGPRSSATG
jgi:tetratricopeptide (TPR) repeat protein